MSYVRVKVARTAPWSTKIYIYAVRQTVLGGLTIYPLVANFL